MLLRVLWFSYIQIIRPRQLNIVFRIALSGSGFNGKLLTLAEVFVSVKQNKFAKKLFARKRIYPKFFFGKKPVAAQSGSEQARFLYGKNNTEFAGGA